MKKYTLLFAVLFSTILISAQSLTNVNPNTGMPLEPLSVTITGQNTNFSQATNTAVWFSQGSETIVYPSSFNVVNDTEVDAYITFDANYDAPIVYDLNVYNEIDGMVSLPLSFTLQTLPTPLIISISPNEAMLLETLTVTVSGENTHFNQATNTTVWFSQGSETISSNSFNVTDDTNIEAEFSFPATSLLGYYNVNVFSELDGEIVLEDGFQVGSNSIRSGKDFNLIISPNPSKDIFYIKSDETIENIKLYNVNGRLINTFNVFSKETSLNINNLSKGVYFLTLKLSKTSVSQSIIVE